MDRNAAIQYMLNRLKEPSTWAGIAIFIGFFGVSEDTVSRVVSNAPAIVAAIGALIAIFAPNPKKTVVVTQGSLADSISDPLNADRAAEAQREAAVAAQVENTRDTHNRLDADPAYRDRVRDQFTRPD